MSPGDRRLQRFFQYIPLRSDRSAPLAVQLLGLRGPGLLCLDRTNRKIGRKDVNILMLAVVAKRLRIPLLWTVLDKAGTSNGAERIASMQRYLALFGASPVKTPLGDRDFIGADRIECLLKNDIPFALRVKETMTVERDNGQKFSLKASLCKRRIGPTLKTVMAARPRSMRRSDCPCASPQNEISRLSRHILVPHRLRPTPKSDTPSTEICRRSLETSAIVIQERCSVDPVGHLNRSRGCGPAPGRPGSEPGPSHRGCVRRQRRRRPHGRPMFPLPRPGSRA